MKLSRNEIKLSFEEPRFYVDEENRIVKCKVFFTMLTPQTYDGNIAFPTLPRTCVTAKAVCCPEDPFDSVTGKKIALAKAENKAYDLALRTVAKEVDKIMTVSMILNDFINKAYHCNAHNIEYIDVLS